MRIFVDADILFSAAKSEGAVRELLGRLSTAGHTLCADAYVVAEARRNLEQKGAKALQTFIALLSQVEVAPFQVAGLPPDATALLPEKDQLVLASAIRLGVMPWSPVTGPIFLVGLAGDDRALLERANAASLARRQVRLR